MRLKTGKRQINGKATDFNRAFSREMLLGERLRATALAFIYILLVGIVLAYDMAAPPGSVILPTNNLIMVFIAGAIYEIFTWSWWGIIFRMRERVPDLGRYINTIIEVSFVTGVIVLITEFLTPLYALVTPLAFVYFLFIILSALRLDFWLSAFTGIVAALEYSLMVIYYLGEITSAPGYDPAVMLPFHHMGKAGLLLFGGLVTGFVTMQIKRRVVRSLQTVAERDMIVDIFGQHVSREIADEILYGEAGVIESEEREVTIMFVDIRNFSRFAHHRSAHDVVTYLNDFYDMLVDVINDHKGVVFKFMGDGLLAVFGAPYQKGNSRQQAVAAAKSILQEVNEKVHNGDIEPTRIGIGIHHGNAVTGHVGSKTRKEYTIIGDVVNLANRIEQLNKQIGSQLLVSEDVWKAIAKQHPNAIALGPMNVRGVEDKVKLWRLV